MSGLGPLGVTSIIERLRTQVSALKLVGGAAERAAVEQAATLVTPAAFVILAGEDIHTTSASSGLYIHRVRATLHVLYQVRHYQDGARGAAQAEVLTGIVAAGRAALNNWRPAAPTGASVETIHGAGRAQLLALRERDAFWLDPFEVVYRGTA